MRKRALVVDDRTFGFLTWLHDEKDYTLDELLYVLQKPWKFRTELEEYEESLECFSFCSEELSDGKS